MLFAKMVVWAEGWRRVADTGGGCDVSKADVDCDKGEVQWSET